ncbi:Cytochrome P450 monooxygenase 151 [Psilocybe cubensis]|nr:Cytochrome P450 monooxygenase 151 [Psilocybe cubensis]KAH9482481.1 Cytochrome P450 monooxygenase 151 [Psilocybe cubensis]
MIHDGYSKYYGGAFKVSMMSKWMVVITGPDMINDIRKASDEQLSSRAAIAETAQSDYMISPRISTDPYHVGVVRTPLTRHLGTRFNDIKDEIASSFSDLVPCKGDEWASIPVYKTIVSIVCRTSNRVFVGLPLCRNPEYRELNEQFTLDVVAGAQFINMFPKILRPVIGRLRTKASRRIETAISLAGPLFQEQLDKETQYGKDRPDKPNNLISWLIDVAEGEQRDIRDLVIRLLSVNFGAIHTTSMAFTHILYDLATYPEYVKPLREEIESIIATEGWTKVSTVNMHKVDSFIKESQRIAASGLMMRRVAMKDFTFSNGITVPAGTHLGFATSATHMDESKYDNPSEFQGFRFAELRDKEGESKQHQMISLSLDYGVFGIGKHACPGRFFAVNELKTMLAHVLLNYDVKLVKEKQRPENWWMSAGCIPNMTAELMFRRRQA